MAHFKKFNKNNNLLENETIIDYIEGNKQRKTKGLGLTELGELNGGVLILTNQRLIFFRSGLTGTKIESYPLHEIVSTSFATGILLTTITISLTNYTFNFLGINKSKIEEFNQKLIEEFNQKLDNREISQKTTTTSDKPQSLENNLPPPTKNKSKVWKITVWVFLFFAVIAFFLLENEKDICAAYEGVRSDDTNVSLIQDKKMGNIKRSVVIILKEPLNEYQLCKVAYKVKGMDNAEYERIFIEYYLNRENVNKGAWATTHFNPDLEVSILNFTREKPVELDE